MMSDICICGINSDLRGPTHATTCPKFSTGQEAAIMVDPESEKRYAENEQRVRAADAEAEAAWRMIHDTEAAGGEQIWALIAIAAELRAQRIARRPGAGS
jgi:hypothetical protein